jgi:hypothetical protein
MGLNGLLRYFKKRREVEASYSVIGSQKSGTTWLRDCIHPFAPFCKPEWYFPELIEATHRWLNTYGSSLPPEERNTMLLKILRNAREAALMGSKGEKSAYPCGGPLTPVRADVHPLAVEQMKSYFPECKITVIVRDPRAVYNSLCHYLNGFKPNWAEEVDVAAFAKVWEYQNLRWADSSPDCLVRYEDLKTDFRKTMKKVLDASELYQDDLGLRKLEADVYPIEKLRPRQPEIYRTGTVDEWRSKVDPRKVDLIGAHAKEGLSRFGYT